jgi:hypothetical protein
MEDIEFTLTLGEEEMERMESEMQDAYARLARKFLVDEPSSAVPASDKIVSKRQKKIEK